MNKISIMIAAVLSGTAAQAKAKTNVLFISCDDLKPLLSVYGDPIVKTPNIERLAKMGITFENAYCQQAVCAPSRFSAFTGLRPDTLKVWDIHTKFRPQNPGLKTIVDQFADKGYSTAGVGKLYHHEDQQKWTIKPPKTDELLKGRHISGYRAKSALKYFPEEGEITNHWKFKSKLKKNNVLFSSEAEDVADDEYYDGAIARQAAKYLAEFKKSKTPFFLAVGFKKPHLPFIAPKKYWDMYDRETLPLANYRKEAKNSPRHAYHTWGELKNYSDIANEKNLVLDDDKQRELIHGYYACVSYMDAQLGVVLDAVEKHSLQKNTVITLWGDHGWHLGDHGLWCKHSNFEQAARIPMFLAAPGVKGGKRYTGMAELVDLVPTIFELTNVTATPDLEGTSLVKSIKTGKGSKEYSVCQYPRMAKGKAVMGYSLRTERYRFTAWYKWDKKSGTITDTVPVDMELYDYSKDPDETQSFARSPEYSPVIEKHQKMLNNFLKIQ